MAPASAGQKEAEREKAELEEEEEGANQRFRADFSGRFTAIAMKPRRGPRFGRRPLCCIFSGLKESPLPRWTLNRSPTGGSEMDEEADVEAIIALCDKLAAVCRGYKNRVVQQATMNVCAAALVNVSGTLHQAERAANELASRVKEAMRSQAECAADELALQLKEGARNQADSAADELAVRLKEAVRSYWRVRLY